VMSGGRIEQLGSPSELYERPRTAFVAGFLGVSNLLYGTVAGETSVQLEAGGEVRVTREALAGRTGRIAVGVRPEKVRLAGGERNTFSGRVAEVAYVGVSTQYIVETVAGPVTVYVQNAEPGAAGIPPGGPVELSFSPESAFVVDTTLRVKEEE
jgi:spermidine/putrescine transport system ATP-binding protein